MDAADKRTGEIILYDLRINSTDLLNKLTAGAKEICGIASQPDPGSLVAENWISKGDPLPQLLEWARQRWGRALDELPNVQELLHAHRAQFGRVPGISERTMREVRRKLAPEKLRRGSAPTHRR